MSSAANVPRWCHSDVIGVTQPGLDDYWYGHLTYCLNLVVQIKAQIAFSLQTNPFRICLGLGWGHFLSVVWSENDFCVQKRIKLTRVRFRFRSENIQAFLSIYCASFDHSSWNLSHDSPKFMSNTEASFTPNLFGLVRMNSVNWTLV